MAETVEFKSNGSTASGYLVKPTAGSGPGVLVIQEWWGLDDMSGAVDFLAGHQAVTSKGIGVVGFCMGGMLSFIIAANRGDKVKAVVPFYGFPQGPMEPDWSKLTCAVRGHMAEHDNFFKPEAARALEAKLRKMGKDVTLTVHPGTGHAFMAPHNALGTLNKEVAARIWPEVVKFLKETLR
ncbi:MAG: dienelactone hydrolase family protein [Acidobacteria bacterium]|nr:dienelactone hydrolase family protein [Acidobacteriota bacterium]